MKKISELCKESLESEFSTRLKEENNIFFINYSGISASKLSELRTSLKQLGARLIIYKNTICRRTLGKLKLNEMCEFINGPVGLIFVGEDPVAVSKILVNFKKQTEKLSFLGGFWQAKILSQERLKELSLLPPKIILQAKCVSLIKSPITNFVMVLNATLLKFLLVLKAINEKKRGG